MYLCYVFHKFLGKKCASCVENGVIFKIRKPNKLGNHSGGNSPETFVKSAFNLLHNFSDHKVDTQNLHYTGTVKGGSQLNALFRYSFAAVKLSRSFCLVI
jgi:hypothetical protein